MSLAQDAPAGIERVEHDYALTAQRIWSKGWDAAKQAILTSVAVGEPEQGLARAGDAMRDQLAEGDARTLTRLVARAFARGMRTVSPRRPLGRQTKRGDITLDGIKSIFESELDAMLQVRDLRAAEWLARDTLFWVGDAWDNYLGARIATMVARAHAEGLGQEEAAKRLAKELPAFDRPQPYWEIVSNAAVGRAVNFGRISGFERNGAKTVKFLSMNDSRVSPICRAMHGRIFNLPDLSALRDRVIAAQTPEDLRATTPWGVQPDAVEGVSSSELAAAGVAVPPLHGRCRSVLIVHSF